VTTQAVPSREMDRDEVKRLFLNGYGPEELRKLGVGNSMLSWATHQLTPKELASAQTRQAARAKGQRIEIEYQRIVAEDAAELREQEIRRLARTIRERVGERLICIFLYPNKNCFWVSRNRTSRADEFWAEMLEFDSERTALMICRACCKQVDVNNQVQTRAGTYLALSCKRCKMGWKADFRRASAGKLELEILVVKK